MIHSIWVWLLITLCKKKYFLSISNSVCRIFCGYWLASGYKACATLEAVKLEVVEERNLSNVIWGSSVREYE